MPTQRQSPFVPHDLKHPLTGRGEGPLAGLSVVVKDMYDIAGERTGGGSPAWLAHQQPAERHSAVVQGLLDAGATITGKTVCDEFFHSVSGINPHYGTPLNVRAPDRIPGGSSSGSASACAAGCCDIAIGSDTGGSVRIPGALCGLFGIRTTRGRMDMSGAMAMAPSFDAGGWFAHSPGVFKKAGSALLRGTGNNNTIDRVVALEDAFGNANPDVAALCRKFLSAAVDSLPIMRSEQIASDEIDSWREAMRLTQAFEVWENYGSFVLRSQPQLGPGIAERMAVAATITAAQRDASERILGQARSRTEQLATPGTILALPTAPCVAPLLTTSQQELEAYRIGVMRLVCIASISGLPQVTIPIGTLDRAPVGISFVGWRNGDETLLSLADRLARYLGFIA
jgi:amidase